MAFQPKTSGALGDALPALDLHPSMGHAVWKSILPLAEGFVRRLRTDTRFSPEFAACISALEAQLIQATRSIELLG
jgi:hypothetical protein